VCMDANGFEGTSFASVDSDKLCGKKKNGGMPRLWHEREVHVPAIHLLIAKSLMRISLSHSDLGESDKLQCKTRFSFGCVVS
jgi:hypothetical protein